MQRAPVGANTSTVRLPCLDIVSQHLWFYEHVDVLCMSSGFLRSEAVWNSFQKFICSGLKWLACHIIMELANILDFLGVRTWIVKNRLLELERTFPFLEIPLNQQTKTHSSGQIQLSQSLKLNPRLFESLCTVSTLYFPFLSTLYFSFLSSGFHWKAIKGSLRLVRFIFPIFWIYLICS